MTSRALLFFVAVLGGLAACSAVGLGPAPDAEQPVDVVPFSSVEWEQLNPARGDQSPMAATLYGARDGTAPTGFLLRPVDGFLSPPHIHNVTYRAVVLRGEFHNDDPTAAYEWMPPGSFWTQPRGGVHVTAARGDELLAYVEIDAGPYLVLPVEQRFRTPEAPINVAPTNVVWLDAKDVPALVGDAAEGVRVAYLWGDPRGAAPGGAFVELPAGHDGVLRTRGGPSRVVVVEGRLTLDDPGTGESRILEPGSYLGADGPFARRVRCNAGSGCTLYVRTDGGLGL